MDGVLYRDFLLGGVFVSECLRRAGDALQTERTTTIDHLYASRQLEIAASMLTEMAKRVYDRGAAENHQ